MSTSTKVKKAKTAYIKCVETAVADALIGARTACRGANPKKAKKEKAPAVVRYLKALSATGEQVPYAKRATKVKGSVSDYQKFQAALLDQGIVSNFTEARAYGKQITIYESPKAKNKYTVYQYYKKTGKIAGMNELIL